MATQTRMTSQERRAAIIEAAVRLFAERGFRGATTRELAAVCGVTEPVLYQHFETKRELYKAIIEAKMEEGAERIEWALEPYIDSEDDRGFFTRVAETILAWYASDPDYVRLLLYSALERHELAELFHQHHAVRSYVQVIVDYIRKRAGSGAFRNVTPELAARAFTGSVANYALRQVVFRSAEDRDAARQRAMVSVLVDIFLNGIRKS